MEQSREELLKALFKKAVGYSVDECVEEYTEENGAMRLQKRKVTTKLVPPDTAALKVLLETCGTERVEDMSDEALAKEKTRLLALLKTEEFSENNQINEEIKYETKTE